MYVACSTLCFARYPLERALRVIGELEFSKLDVAIHERGPHLRPSEVAADVAELVAHMKKNGLRFAPATAGAERAYTALHRALADEVARLRKLEAPPKDP